MEIETETHPLNEDSLDFLFPNDESSIDKPIALSVQEQNEGTAFKRIESSLPQIDEESRNRIIYFMFII